MSTNAIQLVVDALVKRLKDGGVIGDIVIGTPDTDPAKAASVSITLVRATPSATLRNHERRTLPTDEAQPPAVLEGAVPLDLSLLLTFNKPVDSAQTELTAMGKVVQILELDPVIGPQEVPEQEARLSLEPASTEELSRIWAMYPSSSYRLSLLYLLTPVWVDPPPSARAARVMKDQRHVGHRQVPA